MNISGTNDTAQSKNSQTEGYATLGMSVEA